MRILWVTLLIVLLSSVAHAQVTVEEIENPSTDVTSFQILQRLSAIEAKINLLPGDQRIQEVASTQATSIINSQNSATENLVILSLLISLFEAGLIFGILLYLKSQGKM